MKRKLLYLTTIVLFSAFSMNAQKTWDFSGDKTNWPSNYPGVTNTNPATTIQKDLLNLTSHTNTTALATTYFGIITNSPTTFSAANFGTDSFVAVDGIKTGGGGAATNNMPTVRYFSFNVDGACTIKVWFRHGSGSGVDRNVFVTDGTAPLGTASVTNTTGTTPNAIVNASATAAGKVYIYSDNGVTIYKIEVIGATVNTPSLGVNDFQADAASNVYSNGKSVFVSNVKSDTQVDVYGISGALVKSFKTGADTSFDLNTGLYVVRSKSAEGEKTAKVLVN